MFVFTESSSRDQPMQKAYWLFKCSAWGWVDVVEWHYGTVLDAKASSIGYSAIAFKIGTPHTPSPGWDPI